MDPEIFQYPVMVVKMVALTADKLDQFIGIEMFTSHIDIYRRHRKMLP